MPFFDPKGECPFCGAGSHPGHPCPFVKEIEFAEFGGQQVRRVVFFSPAELALDESPAPGQDAADYPRLGQKG